MAIYKVLFEKLEPPPPPKMSYMSYNDHTWYSYALPKQDPKNI